MDLHLRAPTTVTVPVKLRPFGEPDPRYCRPPTPIQRNPAGVVDYDPYSPGEGRAYGNGFTRELATWLHSHEERLWFGNGITRELVSWMPAGSGDQTLLDLGCGERRVEHVLRRTGMSYIGLDVAGDAPDVLGTGEALPFADSSIDFVFSLTVLPHIPHPSLACREISRVMKPGSLFIGTVQFLEPCHLQSRHHPSLLGLLDWLEDAELRILELEANANWSGARAIAQMGFYPRRFHIARAVAMVLDGTHKAYRSVKPDRSSAPLGEGTPERYTGGFRFVAQKEA